MKLDQQYSTGLVPPYRGYHLRIHEHHCHNIIRNRNETVKPPQHRFSSKVALPVRRILAAGLEVPQYAGLSRLFFSLLDLVCCYLGVFKNLGLLLVGHSLVLLVTIVDESRQQIFSCLVVASFVLLFSFLLQFTGLAHFRPSSTAPFLVFFGS